MSSHHTDEAAPSERLANVARTAGAAIVFTSIALWCVRGVLPHFQDAFTGGGEIEGWMWRYWWMKRLIVDAWNHAGASYAVRTALVSGSYPETGNVFDLQALSMPLDAWLGNPAHYNAKVILVLVLDGLAGYFLARLLVDDWAASVLCGFTMAFAAYVLLEIDTGRIRQALVFPLPLYAYGLMRVTANRTSLGWAALAGLAFGLCSSVFLFYGMSAAFMTAIWLVWLACPPPATAQASAPQRAQALQARVRYVLLAAASVFGIAQCAMLGVTPAAVGGLVIALLGVACAVLVRRDGARRGAQIALLLVVALTSSLPYATWYIQQAFVRHQALPEVSWQRSFPTLENLENPHNVHSSDDALMNSMQRFRSDSVSWDLLFLTQYPRAVPLALTVLVLGGLVLIPRRPWLFVAFAALGYALSLGPYLKGGVSEAYLARPHGIKLPQAWFFEYVPFFSRLFSPIRMEGLFLTGFGVVAAWSVAMLFRRLRLPVWARVVMVGAIIGSSLWQMEGAGAIPLSHTLLRVPEVYPAIASAEGDGVMELPLREGDYVNYYQIFHGKRVLDGWATGSIPEGYPQSITRWLAENPGNLTRDNRFLHWLRTSNEGESDEPAGYTADDVKAIATYGYRWALLHERGCYIVRGANGHEHYLYMRRVLDARFGKPVKVATERVRERFGESAQPDAEGLYGCEVVLYDLQPLTR